MLRTFLRSYWGITFLVAVGWQVVFTILGAVLEQRFGQHYDGLLGHMLHWDGGWYSAIIHGAYHTNPAAPAFYPLFPMAVSALLFLSGHTLSLAAAGLIVNTFALWLALAALYQIAGFFVSAPRRWWVVALFIASPAAIFMHLFYTEALFCAIAFWAYLFALRQQWQYTGLTLAVLTAARLPAILVVLLCLLEFARAHEWHPANILNRRLLWFSLAPLGFIAYGLYLQVTTGDFLAMFHAYHATTDWAYHVFNPNIFDPILRTMYHAAITVISRDFADSNQVVNNILPAAGIVLLGLTSVYALTVKKMLPLGLFGLTSLVLFTLNSNTISVHRYMLPSLGVYIVVVYVLERYNKLHAGLWGILALGLGLQFYLLIVFVSDHFAG